MSCPEQHLVACRAARSEKLNGPTTEFCFVANIIFLLKRRNWGVAVSIFLNSENDVEFFKKYFLMIENLFLEHFQEGILEKQTYFC